MSGPVAEWREFATTDHRAFVSPTGATFVADDLGVGHTFLCSGDTDRAVGHHSAASNWGHQFQIPREGAPS